MFKIIKVLVISVIVKSSFGQQLPQYSQYLRNQYMVNPGAAGVYDFLDVTISGRMQWVGFTNAPLTSYASFTKVFSPAYQRERYNPSLRISTGPVKNPEIKTGKMKHAVGGQLVADQYGAFNKIQLAGTYAIHLPLNRNYNLSFGTKLGITNNSFLKERAVALDANNDKTYVDYNLNQSPLNVMNLGAGLYLYSNKMFLGISGDNFTKDQVRFGKGTANYNPMMHFNFTGGLKMPINKDFTITPAFLVKYMPVVNPIMEGSLQFEYKESIWVSASYRNKDAIVAMFGCNISRRFKFGYSYDFSISKLKSYNSGGHELVLGVMLR
jgi:type IX secretion system PorP/SprF family membrane protein